MKMVKKSSYSFLSAYYMPGIALEPLKQTIFNLFKNLRKQIVIIPILQKSKLRPMEIK